MIEILDIFPNTIPEEIWVPLDNYVYNIRHGYFISSYGRLYCAMTNKYYPNENNLREDGYISVYLRLVTGELLDVYLHRLVLFVFAYRPDCQYLFVNHKDGIKYHNWVWNLEWVTAQQNTEHALETGLIKRGEDVSYSTITNEQAYMIAQKLSEGYYPIEIQNMLRDIIPNARIKQIAIDMANNQSWKHITRNFDMSNCYKFKQKKSKYPFTDEETHHICKLFETYGSDMQYKAILDNLGFDYSGLDKKELGKISAFISLLRKKEFKQEICNQYNYQYKFNDYRKLNSHKQ